MTECASASDLLAVLTSWPLPSLPFVGWILLAGAVLLFLLEAAMRYGYGGIPDGVLGAVGGVIAGVTVLLWSGSFAASCGGYVVTGGWAAIAASAIVGAIIVWFWRARRQDAGIVVRGYGDGPAGPGGTQP